MAKKAKLPTDVNSRAKAIVDFATSDEESPDPDATNPKRAAAGSKGGRTRSAKLSAEERSELARRAARARWAASEGSRRA